MPGARSRGCTTGTTCSRRRRGEAIDAANLSHRFHAALQAAGLPDQRFHDLRHACATLRLEQGEELAVVSRILGQASITTTANVYGHLTDAMLGRTAERTDVILGADVPARWYEGWYR